MVAVMPEMAGISETIILDPDLKGLRSQQFEERT